MNRIKLILIFSIITLLSGMSLKAQIAGPGDIPTVTGTASYCAGSSGEPVGIDISDVGTTYILYKDGVAQTPTVAGTGSALFFGPQLVGTYVVKAYLDATPANVFNIMGSAIITLTPDMIASAASFTPTLCINTVLTDITHATTRATGIGSPTGLPTGITATWSSNIITITGTPTVAGTFNYSIPLIGGCGNINATGTIIVNASTAITSQPSTTAQTTCINTTFNPISVTATGTGTLTYQWYSNTSAIISDATKIDNATASIYTPQSTAAGILYYYCVVKGDCGTEVNSAFSGGYTVNAATAITSQPSTTAQTTCINTAFNPISVTATGTGTLTYQWYSNTSANTSDATKIENATASSYTPQSTATGILYYYCVVKGDCGTEVYSAFSGAFITNAATAIVSQSTATQTTCINTAFSPISVTASGTGTLTYQWYSNASAITSDATKIDNATASSYTPLSTAAGILYYYCVVKGDCGTEVNSVFSGAFITNAATAIVSQSTATQTTCINTAFSPISVTASGTGTLTYQWYSNTSAITSGATKIDNATAFSYIPQSTATGILYYYCVVKGDCGTEVYSAFSGGYTVNAATAITNQSTATQTQYQTLTFSPITVTASGTGTLNYQWYSNTTAATTDGTYLGSDDGAQTASYTPQSTVVGTLYYYCVVTGGCGSVTSAVSEAIIVVPNVRQLNLKVFLQGLYDTTNDTMNKCEDYVNSAIVDKFTGTITDLITVELHNATTYATVEYTATAVELHQDGTCNSAGLGYIEIPAAYAGNYYITIKTRNHLETTTASAISFTDRTISYDFTDAATKAYGSNMKQLKSGVYGLYAGDVSKSGTNGAIEPLTDYAAVKAAISNTPTGYQPADINGDGKVEPLTDYATVKAAISLNINAVLP